MIKAMLPEFQSLTIRFNSGNVHLDNFLKSSDALNSSLGKTYVFLSEDEHDLIGYYNLGTGSLEEYQGHNRTKYGGAIHINEFAVDIRYQNIVFDETADGEKVYLSDIMLIDCIKRIESIRENHVGASFVTLNATLEGERFYLRMGFDYLEDNMTFSKEYSEISCIPMYFPLDIEH